MQRLHRTVTIILQLALIAALTGNLAFAQRAKGRDRITTQELKDWLSYFASDEFEGRDTYSEGLGMAAYYLATQLKSFGVKPGGDNGSYFQRVAVQGVKAENQSTLTVEVNGQSRTFKNKEGIDFAMNVGSKRSFTTDQIDFLGYGLSAAPAHDDLAGKAIKGKVALFLGGIGGPKGLDRSYARLMINRGRTLIEQYGAAACIGPGAGTTGMVMTSGRRPNQMEGIDFSTVQNLQAPAAPSLTAQEAFFEFLLSASDVKYAELKAKALAGDPLPHFTLKNVRLTFNLDAEYHIVRTQYTRNVIGIIEGSDPRLKETFVAFGAHYDHVGYSDSEIAQTPNGLRLRNGRGRINDPTDRIWNGADDDGSGSIGILAVAKAFATGRKPKRSLIFIWHAGEERGLLGSRFYVDHPTVPLDKIVAQINIDMIGRNKNNLDEYANSVFIVGADRISTELHNLTIDANAALVKPLTLDFEMNDLGDPEQIYYRSDHYSYAAKGIPIVFFFTGVHPDYHANTDSAEKINFDKMTRITQMVYELGERVANLDHAPVRDNRGPRMGKGSAGKLE